MHVLYNKNMEQAYKDNFKEVLTAKQNIRDIMVADGIHSLYSCLVEHEVPPMKRMAIIEAIVYYPLLIDGPINEDELHFIKVALNQENISLKEANKIANRNKTAKEIIFDAIKELSFIVMYEVLKVVLIGLIIDSNDQMNDVEGSFFDELYYAVVDAM